MIRALLWISCFCVAAPLWSQADTSATVKRNIEAHNHIRDLREGVLLVRLQDRKKGLEILRSKGLHQMAQAEEAEQKAYNQEVIEAFKGEFTFCPVYFFYSSQSEEVRLEQWDEVAFLNDSLQPDSTIMPPTDKVYIAEFSKVQDESEGFDGATGLRTTSDGAKMQNIRYTTSVSGFSALIVKDNQIRQLKRPFPYYVKTYETVFFRRTKRRAVQLLQENLERFLRS